VPLSTLPRPVSSASTLPLFGPRFFGQPPNSLPPHFPTALPSSPRRRAVAAAGTPARRRCGGGG
jgi:hypothetical protein